MKTKEMLDNIPEVKLLINSSKKGAIKSFNEGLKMAVGRYVTVFSDDDVWLQNRAYILLKYLNNNSNIDILISRALIKDELGELIRPKKFISSRFFLDTHYNFIFNLRNPTTFMMTTVVAKNEVWKKINFDESLVDHEDIFWLHQCQKAGYKVHFASEITVQTYNSIKRTRERFINAGDIWIKRLGEISPKVQRRYLTFHATKPFVLRLDYKGLIKLKHDYYQIYFYPYQRAFLNFLICSVFFASKLLGLKHVIVNR